MTAQKEGPKPGKSWGVVPRLLGMLLILIPLWIASGMVNGLISERESVRNGAENEISEKWGGDQILSGPVLIVPWMEKETTTYNDAKGVERLKTVLHERSATFLPEDLKVAGTLKPELRRRGIFETVLYVAELHVTGRFLPADFRALNVDPDSIRWDKAMLSVGVSDPRGIRDAVDLAWQGKQWTFKPGAGQGTPFSQGIHVRGLARPAAKAGEPFAFKLQLNGSRSLRMAPVGRRSEVQLSSTWPDPSFTGEYLPEQRAVDEKGFKAQWVVLELARKFPQAWRDHSVSGETLENASMGVGLVKTASTYQQSARATKYAVLFLLLTFTFFFLFEVLGGLKVHPVQYLLVGAALVVFYLLLLSVSEHIGFNASYAVSTTATLAILWAYISAFLKEPKRAKLLIAILAGLYGYLFVILRLNDYALLMGSLGVFAALATLMLLTRHIDWYDLDKKKD